MPSYPYYSEPTHSQGTTAIASGNAARSTATLSTEGRLPVEVFDKIMLLETAKHPFTTLLTTPGRKDSEGKTYKGAGLAKEPITSNPEFSWIEDYRGGRFAKVAAAYDTSDPVTITVTGAGSSPAYIFTVGDQVKNARTGEVMLVTVIASTTTITVSRAFGTTVATAGVAGDGLYIIGNVNEENAGVRNANMTQSARNSNYTQIFRHTIAVTGTEAALNPYGGKD